MQIEIRNLKVSCILGAYPEEKISPRIILITVIFEYDAKTAKISDELNDSLNYDDLAKSINLIAAKKEYNLIEHLAQEIYSELKTNQSITKLEIIVKKPTAICTAEFVSARISDFN